MYTKLFNCFFAFFILLSSPINSQVVVPNKLISPNTQIDNVTAKRSQIWISGEWIANECDYIWKDEILSSK